LGEQARRKSLAPIARQEANGAGLAGFFSRGLCLLGSIVI